MPFPLAAIGAGAGLLGGLLGGGQKGPTGLDPGTLNKFFGAGALSGDITQLYQLLSRSPQFQQMLLQNSIQGQQFQGDLSAGLAQRGLSTSGIGTIANAAGQSAISSGELGLRGGLFGSAGSLAQQNLMQRLQSYTQGRLGQPQGPSFLSQISGDVLGASIPSLFQMGGQKQAAYQPSTLGNQAGIFGGTGR
jgi:hypothetical protein